MGYIVHHVINKVLALFHGSKSCRRESLDHAVQVSKWMYVYETSIVEVYEIWVQLIQL